MFPPPSLVSVVLSNFLVKHVTGQFRPLILVAPWWIEAPWLQIVLSMFKDIRDLFVIIRDLVDLLVTCKHHPV